MSIGFEEPSKALREGTGARAGAPQRTRRQCALRHLHRLQVLHLPLLAPQLQTCPARSWAYRPHALRQAALRWARSVQAPASVSGLALASSSRRPAPPQAAHRARGNLELCASGDGPDRDSRLREAALEVVGAGGQKRAWLGGDNFLSVAAATVGWSVFPGTPGPPPYPSRPESHSSSSPGDASQSGRWSVSLGLPSPDPASPSSI